MIRFATFIALCAVLAGCQTVNKNIAPKAAQVISAYCLEDQSVRLVIRQQVNDLIKPNTVRIDCAGDVQP